MKSMRRRRRRRRRRDRAGILAGNVVEAVQGREGWRTPVTHQDLQQQSSPQVIGPALQSSSAGPKVLLAPSHTAQLSSWPEPF